MMPSGGTTAIFQLRSAGYRTVCENRETVLQTPVRDELLARHSDRIRAAALLDHVCQDIPHENRPFQLRNRAKSDFRCPPISFAEQRV